MLDWNVKCVLLAEDLIDLDGFFCHGQRRCDLACVFEERARVVDRECDIRSMTEITVYSDGSFTFVLKTSPTAVLLPLSPLLACRALALPLAACLLRTLANIS